MLIIYTMAICIIRQDHSDEHKIEIGEKKPAPCTKKSKSKRA